VLGPGQIHGKKQKNKQKKKKKKKQGKPHGTVGMM
jgi:hypothetical protein